MSKSLFKRIGTSVVALSLVISSLSAVTVSAEDSSDFHPSVTYAKGDYTFGKLSHPDKPVAYGHFPRPSGPRSPARQGHIKRPVLRLAEPSFLRPANQCC